MIKKIILLVGFALLSCSAISSEVELWKIGHSDNSSKDLALGPNLYKDFLKNDFGYEDRYYLIGKSKPNKDMPYVLPGPSDTWGGTWGTSGWRTHDINILFGLDELKNDQGWKLLVDLIDVNEEKALVKLSVNDYSEKFLLKGNSNASIEDDSQGEEQILTLNIPAGVVKNHGNVVKVTILEGSWVVFDQVKMLAPFGTSLVSPSELHVRNVKPAHYELCDGADRFQPLLVDVEHLDGMPQMNVELDGKEIFSETLEKGRYIFEVPMPAVKKSKISTYKVYCNDKLIQKGKVKRGAFAQQTYADYVDTRIGTAHSRWMIAPGPWMPFSMVKMSPDNQNMGWQAGYQPSFESVGTFSHIHEWTMGGLGMMPTNGKLQIKVGDELNPDSGYRSRIDKNSEEAPIGFYKVRLSDTDILAEVTATERCGFHRYTFPKDKDGRVMIDLHIQAEYDYKLLDVEMKKVSGYRIEGRSHQISPRPHVWSNDADQEYVVNFVIEFDQPIKAIGGWVNDELIKSDKISAKEVKEAGMYVEFDTNKHPVVQSRSGISLVSIDNASENLEQEISKRFAWNYDAVVQNQKAVWNSYFARLSVDSNNYLEKERFYSNFFRSLCRNTWSDVNGQWMSPDEKVEQLAHKDHVALGCDAFWNSFWNLNQFWNLLTPEWSSKWVNSQLAMYDANGWLAKGPAGMEYIPVMVAEHEIPLLVGAYQMGIRDFDKKKALEAMLKMQNTPAAPVAGGFAGNRDLEVYLKYKYVPYDKGRFSNTLEYSYDDWAVSQYAKALGEDKLYEEFADRGNWWKNAIAHNGYATLRDSTGKFMPDFDPFQSGRNEEYVEGNAWQLTYFVPQDVPGLAKMIGKKSFIDRLNWGFEVSEPWRYNAPNDQYWDYPVVQGNQQSMHFAFLFNWVQQPWLTQKWSRSIIEKYYGYGVANAYLGDEDQGQMSAWFIMASIGLFQTDGGASVNPVYEIASPLFRRVEIDLGKRYGRGEKFVIEAENASRKNIYVQSAELNGKPLVDFKFPASELLKGGKLKLVMGSEPNKEWGVSE
ncbi:MAG: GH92 family glycosyl hydrolase [Bacteroidales bacterium]